MRDVFHFDEAVPLSAQPGKQRDTIGGLVRTTGFAGYVLTTMALSGCVSEPLAYERPGHTIPKPKAALLSKQPAPKCLYEEPAEPSSAPAAPTDVPASEAEREATKRRERERDCFQAAEQRVREKLTRLQTQVQATLQAMDNLYCIHPVAPCGPRREADARRTR